MVGAWHAGTLILIAVPHARLAQQTRSMIGAPVSAAQRCEWASAGQPYVLNLCELHLARLQGVLPKGGVRVVKQYQSGGSEAESPVRQHH
jgi:hypothetical protein